MNDDILIKNDRWRGLNMAHMITLRYLSCSSKWDDYACCGLMQWLVLKNAAV